MAKKLLRLTWIDETGEAYYTQDVTPTVAKELFKRARLHVVDFPGTCYGHPMTSFSRAAVERSRRGVVVKGERHAPTETQKRVLVTLPEDNPEQTPNERPHRWGGAGYVCVDCGAIKDTGTETPVCSGGGK